MRVVLEVPEIMLKAVQIQYLALLHLRVAEQDKAVKIHPLRQQVVLEAAQVVLVLIKLAAQELLIKVMLVETLSLQKTTVVEVVEQGP